MFKIRLAGAAVIALAMTLLSSGVAQAYPDCGISLTLSRSTLVGGGTFQFTADSGEVDCDWTVTYDGKTRTGDGQTFSGSFKTDVVDKKSTSKIRATCTFDNATAGALASTSTSADVTPAFYSAGAGESVQTATQVCKVSANVTLLPRGTSPAAADDGLLPNTGGSNLWILMLGGALVLGGAGATYAARHRHNSH
ncbi:LPXTG cell wall anchor domain-containing protein [Aeromicrobium sp.]|uniref:LPXTG cell wall anchor domain-containing protein n=1 Tax=Aeromicrobium sp. TaxID=1871063 RepID=UPI0030BC649B